MPLCILSYVFLVACSVSIWKFYLQYIPDMSKIEVVILSLNSLTQKLRVKMVQITLHL